MLLALVYDEAWRLAQEEAQRMGGGEDDEAAAAAPSEGRAGSGGAGAAVDCSERRVWLDATLGPCPHS